MAETTHTSLPRAVDRDACQAEIDALRVREKAHTHEGDAIAAARRRLPMVEVDAAATLIGPDGPVALSEVFEGRRQLIAYYHMWYPGKPAAEQCEGCTLYNGHVRELSYLHSRDVTHATLCQAPETYWTTGRGIEVMGNGYPLLLDRNVYGRQESWEDSPAGWPRRCGNDTAEEHPYRTNSRPIAQWPRLDAGHSDDLGNGDGV